MNILKEVSLHPLIVFAYKQFLTQLMLEAFERDILPDEIPDEQTTIKDDGSLIIYLDLPYGKGRVEFIIPPVAWAWKHRN